MITSNASPHAIAKLRHMVGPNPAGSRLTNNERLHLIFLISVMVMGINNSTHLGYGAIQQMETQLSERGLAKEELKAVFAANIGVPPPDLADIIAVHPSLGTPVGDYLD